MGVQLPGGRLVFPCNHVSPTRGWLRTRYELRSHVVISDDGGDSFRLGGEGPAECNEAQVALVGGRLLLSMRDWSGRGRRRVAVSEDEGESWRDLGHAGGLVVGSLEPHEVAPPHSTPHAEATIAEDVRLQRRRRPARPGLRGLSSLAARGAGAASAPLPGPSPRTVRDAFPVGARRRPLLRALRSAERAHAPHAAAARLA